MNENSIVVLFIMTALFAGCGSQHITVGQDYSLLGKIMGLLGVFPETGNIVFCFENNDSVFWVDPSVWCTYTIENDTITMWHDTYEYFRGRIEYRNDSLFLGDNDFTWEFERNKDELLVCSVVCGGEGDADNKVKENIGDEGSVLAVL